MAILPYGPFLKRYEANRTLLVEGVCARGVGTRAAATGDQVSQLCASFTHENGASLEVQVGESCTDSADIHALGMKLEGPCEVTKA